MTNTKIKRNATINYLYRTHKKDEKEITKNNHAKKKKERLPIELVRPSTTLVMKHSGVTAEKTQKRWIRIMILTLHDKDKKMAQRLENIFF